MAEMTDRLQAVLGAVEDFSGCVEIGALGMALMAQLEEHLGVHGGSLYVHGGDVLRLAGGCGPRHAPDLIPLPLRPSSPMAQCMRSRQPLLLDAADGKSSFESSGWGGYTTGQALLVPLFDHTRSVSGVVCIHNKAVPPFTEADIQLAKLLVGVGSEALRSIQSQQAVRESESRMSALLRHLPGMAYRSRDTASWRMDFVSEGCLALTGYEAESFLGDGEFCYGDLLHAEDRERVERQIRDAVSRHEVMETTYRIRTADLQERWVWHKVACHVGRDELPAGVHGFITDITSQRASERLLSQIATALDQASEAVLITDIQGNILYANTPFLRLCARGGRGRMGTHAVLPLDVPTDHPSLVSLRECERAGKPCTVEMPGYGEEGVSRQLRIQLAPLRTEEGTLSQYVYLIGDVSEEQKLKMQLLQAQKMEAIGSLASGIAHEINTPIQYVGDNLRFVQESIVQLTPIFKALTETSAPEEARRVVETIRGLMEQCDWPFLREEIPRALMESAQGIKRVAEIVRAMKAFAHPDDEEVRLANLNDAVQTAATVARNEWKYAAELAFDLDKSLPQVPCQVGALNQVFLNLMVNAAHAIVERNEREHRKEKGRITVSTRVCEGWAEIAFCDNGAGISERNRSKIFDPFYTTKSVGKGTGQGLALAHSVVVDQHHGVIEVESEEGQGSVFRIRLPLEPAKKG